MKKASFLLIFVLIFAFFSISFNFYELISNPINVVYAEDQTCGGEQTEGEQGAPTTGGEGGSEQAPEGEETNKDNGLTFLGVKIEGVWFWLAFVAGLGTIGFYVVKLIASYRKPNNNKED